MNKLPISANFGDPKFTDVGKFSALADSWNENRDWKVPVRSVSEIAGRTTRRSGCFSNVKQPSSLRGVHGRGVLIAIIATMAPRRQGVTSLTWTASPEGVANIRRTHILFDRTPCACGTCCLAPAAWDWLSKNRTAATE